MTITDCIQCTSGEW